MTTAEWLEAYDWSTVTDEDLKVLKRQLGRVPKKLVAVAQRCHYGQPQVVVNYPLPCGTSGPRVFPTLFWLTCPYLVHAVGALEAAGLIGAMRAEVTRSSDFARSLADAHEAHARLRLDLCGAEDLSYVCAQYPEQYRVLVSTGVGGIRQRDGVKCLHTHLADYLGRSRCGAERIEAVNPVGRRTAGLLLKKGVDLRGARCEACGESCRPNETDDTRRVTAVDVGSNSVRRLTVDFSPRSARLTPVESELRTTRLGRSTPGGSAGDLHPAAVEETLEALGNFGSRVLQLGTETSVAVATAALRKATSPGDVLTAIWERSGLSVPIISSEREAELAFVGAVRSLSWADAEEILTIDVGGGSTEVVSGTVAGGVESSISAEVGAVGVGEILAAAPDQGDVDAVRYVDNVLVQAGLAGFGTREYAVVALGGSATALAAIQAGLRTYDPDQTHGAALTRRMITEMFNRLQRLSPEERENVVGLSPDRAESILGGALILIRVLNVLKIDRLRVSENGILAGLIWDLWGSTDSYAVVD